MRLIRPEITDALVRGQELILAVVVMGVGLWLASLGGYLLLPLGLIVLGIGAVLAWQAWARMRFARSASAPGLVELDEAQVGFLGPDDGGFLSLDELVELRLITVQGRRMWRLKQSDGQALLIPVEAQGAERLFDAFSSLPGMDTSALIAALEAPPAAPDLAEARVVWRRPGRPPRHKQLARHPHGPS